MTQPITPATHQHHITYHSKHSPTSHNLSLQPTTNTTQPIPPATHQHHITYHSKHSPTSHNLSLQLFTNITQPVRLSFQLLTKGNSILLMCLKGRFCTYKWPSFLFPALLADKMGDRHDKYLNVTLCNNGINNIALCLHKLPHQNLVQNNHWIET